MKSEERLQLCRGVGVSRGLVGSSRLFILPDPNVERPLVRIGMCPSAAIHRLIESDTD